MYDIDLSFILIMLCAGRGIIDTDSYFVVCTDRYRGYEGKRRGDDRMRMRRIVKHKMKSMKSNESLNKVNLKPVTDTFIMKAHLALAE